VSVASTMKSAPAIGSFAARAILVLLMFVTLLPFITMFSAALAPSGTYPPGLQWPADPQWGNFVDAFISAKLDRLLLSSVTIVACVVPVSVLIGSMAGFGLAKLAPRGSQFVYLLFVLGLTLPLEVVIIPLYYEMQWLGLLNTKFAIILPLIGLFMPFSIFWMRAHFVNVPAEMSEAAEIDGASAWQQFWLVQVPLARPAILSLAILQFLWTWNSFLLPLVLVEVPLERTMAGALGAFQGQW
jgi:raffinose/stachyose/melibiose transport system permease protein